MGAPRCRISPDQDEHVTTDPTHVPRRRTLVRAPLALVAACALAACGTAPKREALTRPASQPRPDPDSAGGGDPSEFIVGGHQLNAGLLRRFYAAHGFRAVWTRRPDQADALVESLVRQLKMEQPFRRAVESQGRI